MLYFIASKILSFAINPIFWIITLLLLALLRKTGKKKYIRLSLFIILVMGNTYVTNFFTHLWEKGHYVNKETLDKFDTYIILGGYNEWNGYTEMQDCNAAGDRLFNMLPYFLDSTKTIIISGGSGKLMQPDLKEADITEKYLSQIQPKARVLYENMSKNTLENIVNSKALVDSFGLSSVCVVSSAMHMRRSDKIISKQELQWKSGGVESMMELDPIVYDIIIPRSENLNKWYAILHEWVGYIVS